MLDIFGSSIILILAGLLIAFAGRVLWKIVWFIIGALIGIALVMAAVSLLSFVGYQVNETCLLIALLIAAIACGMMAIGYIKFCISMTAGVAGFYAGSMLTGSFIVGAILGIVLFVIVYIKFNDILSVMSATIGGLMMGAGVAEATGMPILLLVVAIPVAIAGSYVQLKIERKQKDEGKGRIEDEV